jgi:hypothetical protein
MSKQEDFNDLEDWSIELDRIINSRNFTSIVKQLAVELKSNPYKTVGSFFDTLSNYDLDILMEKLDNEDLEEILLITELLARAEGAGARDMEDITRNVNVMTVMIAGEALARKGLVEAFHSNMSFGEDSSDRPIFKKIEQDE